MIGFIAVLLVEAVNYLDVLEGITSSGQPLPLSYTMRRIKHRLQDLLAAVDSGYSGLEDGDSSKDYRVSVDQPAGPETVTTTTKCTGSLAWRLRQAQRVSNTKYLRRPRALVTPSTTLPCLEPSDPGVWDSDFLAVRRRPRSRGQAVCSRDRSNR